MHPVFIALGIYFALALLMVYVLMCGNNKFHRSGIIGKMYVFLMGTVPDTMERWFTKMLPKRCQPGRGGCLGKNGPCRYFIFLFYVGIYVGFIVVYLSRIHPNLEHVYSSHLGLHRVLSFLVLPGPWIICLILQIIDPGTITAENVRSYLEQYKYDNVLYTPKQCRTLHLPVVARSRYCKYTERRVARYDHYCPWLLATIGERTQRFFLMFLFLNIVPSVYYSVGSFRYLQWLLSTVRARWSTSRMENFMLMFIITIQNEPFVVGIAIVLTGIAVALTIFLAQQMYYVSKNITQIELDKIELVQEEREMRGDKTKYVHFYDNGFVQNWKDVLFPPKIAKHAPVTMADFDEKKFPIEEKKKAFKPVTQGGSRIEAQKRRGGRRH